MQIKEFSALEMWKLILTGNQKCISEEAKNYFVRPKPIYFEKYRQIILNMNNKISTLLSCNGYQPRKKM